jgi:hypothetical protein
MALWGDRHRCFAGGGEILPSDRPVSIEDGIGKGSARSIDGFDLFKPSRVVKIYWLLMADINTLRIDD